MYPPCGDEISARAMCQSRGGVYGNEVMWSEVQSVNG
jgi:hypothetical protein